MSFKQVFYDARSINPKQGDEVTVLVQHFEQAPEELKAVYMGSVQMEAYTTPYFKFMCPNHQVRLISSNAIREWRFTIQAPNLETPQLPKPDDYDDDDYSHRF
jgi:hypothetical protein